MASISGKTAGLLRHGLLRRRPFRLGQVLAIVLAAGWLCPWPWVLPAVAGPGPFYFVTYDSEGVEASRLLVNLDHELIPTTGPFTVNVGTQPGTFYLDDGFVPFLWDFQGSSGRRSELAGEPVEWEVFEPSVLELRDVSGDAELLAGVAGGVFLMIGLKLWEIIRDSMWRRSVAV